MVKSLAVISFGPQEGAVKQLINTTFLGKKCLFLEFGVYILKDLMTVMKLMKNRSSNVLMSQH